MSTDVTTTETADTATPTVAPDAAASTAPDDGAQLLFQEGGEPTVEQVGGESDAEKPQEKPPIEYTDFTIPEGQQFDETGLADFKTLANELNLTQEQAQKVIDLQSAINKRAYDEYIKQVSDWRDATEKDETYGRGNLNKSIAGARDVLRKFGDDELIADFEGQGLGNKLSLIRFLNKIHDATKEDSLGDGAAGGKREKTPAEILFPNMQP